MNKFNKTNEFSSFAIATLSIPKEEIESALKNKIITTKIIKK